ncbi:MAG: class I SAM-dependent methyltransferase [Verrucomicrobia bacterium]|nr:class I SAM-dependent methyltransferase [Verrucomicrobiota bacterium]
MKPVDRLLRSWRCYHAAALLPPDAKLLDIGCGDGWFLRRLERKGRLASGLGVDQDPVSQPGGERIAFRQGSLPGLELGSAEFDAITMIAVLEHFPEQVLEDSVRCCHRWLRPGGKVILTVPSPRVDDILHLLIRLRLADGTHVEEHHGYEVDRTRPLFESAGFVCELHKTFQLGLNHLFVFRKPG